jgi:murein DD-endopeptidase MepM/ murein hydrolase activator NlpD
LKVQGLNKVAVFANESHSGTTKESKKRLLQQQKQKLEQEKNELHKKALALKKVEKQAYQKLRTIENKYSATHGQLCSTKKEVNHTQAKMEETQARLSTVKTKETGLADCAAKRLREIYEGDRLSFLDQLVQVDSLQTLQDRLYYQETIAEQDRKLIAELRLREASLAKHREQLGIKKNQLADLVSQIAQKAMAIAKEKFTQEQLADKLRSQRAFYEHAERELAQESHRLEHQIFAMESSKRAKGGPIATGSGTMCLPLRAPVTSPFGWRTHPIFGVRKFHSGVDLAGPNRSPIHAADSGNVLFTGWYGGYGKVVIISHGKGMATLYAHLSRAAVKCGDNVTKGDVIAYEGSTGFSTGPHLHFEVRVEGKPNNPLNFVR